MAIRMAARLSIPHLFFFCMPLFLFAQNNVASDTFKSAVYNGRQLLVTTTNGYIKIVVYNANVIQVTYLRNTEQKAVSYTTIASPRVVKVAYTGSGTFLQLKTAQLSALINKETLHISFINEKGDTLSTAENYEANNSSLALGFAADKDEAFYGGGSRATSLNKRGQILENYNQQNDGDRFGETNLNISIPFLVSNRSYGLYFDNAAKSRFDVAKTDSSKITFSTTAGAMVFYFVGGQSLDEVTQNYTWLTGRQPLPPRWALGYLTSRYGYKSEREVMEVVSKTKEAGIPLDGLVLDLYWYKDGSLMGNHSWNRDSFPNPQRMLDNLKQQGIKVVLVSEPYITEQSNNFAIARDNHLFAPNTATPTQPYVFQDFWVGPAALLDIFKPETQQFLWGLYKRRIDEGVTGWWLDLGEPESSNDSLLFSWGAENTIHNLYGLIWAKTVFDGYRKDFSGSRIFTLSRSGFAGMQRYATFPWSGDCERSYAGLEGQLPIIIGMGLSGAGYMHSDAGGFYGQWNNITHKQVIEPDLYSRWLEFAAFTPVMRTHAGTGGGGYAPEPIYWDDTTRQRVTRYIKLRYALLPYNYTLAYINSTTGRPLVMPVNYFDNNNRALANINDEYLWGEHLLVAPVITAGQTKREVLFPAGNWIGFNDNRVYKDSAIVYAPIDSLPLFVKDGSIITMAAPLTNTEQYKGDSLMLNYYSSGETESITSEWYYDDGKSPNTLADKQYDLVTFVTRATGNKSVIEINPVHMLHLHKVFSLRAMGKKLLSAKFSRTVAFKIVQGEIVNFEWDGKPLTVILETKPM